MHLIGQFFFWYWLYPGYDRVVHFLGGFWVAFTALSLISERFKSLKSVHILLLGILITIIVGVCWEFFEIAGQITEIGDIGFARDTIGDIISDIVGGLAGTIFCVYRYPISLLQQPVNQNNS